MQDVLESLFEGGYGIFKVKPFDDHQDKFQIYYGSMLASQDNNHEVINDQQLSVLSERAITQRDAFIDAETAQEFQAAFEGLLASAGLDQANLNDAFYYLDPLQMSVNLDYINSVMEIQITNSPQQYTQAEKDWIVKRNYLRYATVFDTMPLDVAIIISNNTANYAHIPEDPSNRSEVFLQYEHAFMEEALGNSIQRTFVHEMGHVCGWFEDEYYPFDSDTTLSRSVSSNCISEGATLYDNAIFNDIDDTAQNPWLQQNLPVEDGGHNLSFGRITGPVPQYNGELYEGCAGVRYNSYRTYERSMMSFHYLIFSQQEFYNGFGPVHRYYINELFFSRF